MLYNDLQIARAKYDEWEAKFNNAKTVEGMPVHMLNVVDRAILAIRAALAHLTVKRSHAALHGSAAAAR